MPQMEKNFKFNLPILTITVNGVQKLMSSINVAKSMGPDGIPNAILKTANHIASALCAIFQCYIDSGELPED